MTVDFIIRLFSYIFISLVDGLHDTCSKYSMVVSLGTCYILVMSHH